MRGFISCEHRPVKPHTSLLCIAGSCVCTPLGLSGVQVFYKFQCRECEEDQTIPARVFFLRVQTVNTTLAHFERYDMRKTANEETKNQ